MKPEVRSTTLAVVLTMLSLGASAGVVPIKFEAIGDEAVARFNDPTVAFDDKPAPFGGSEADLDFSGAWGYRWEMLDELADFYPDEWDAGDCLNVDGCNKSGFIMNRTRDQKAGQIEITLGTGLIGQFIQKIDFQVYTNTGAANMRAFAYNAKGGFQEYGGFTETNGLKVWSDWKTEVTLAEANRIVIDFGGAAFGLDNLNITLSDASTGGGGTGGGGTGGGGTGGGGTGGGTVPEPASYALVGLALLAAGAARRRKA